MLQVGSAGLAAARGAWLAASGLAPSGGRSRPRFAVASRLGSPSVQCRNARYVAARSYSAAHTRRPGGELAPATWGRGADGFSLDAVVLAFQLLPPLLKLPPTAATAPSLALLPLLTITQKSQTTSASHPSRAVHGA